MIIRLRGKLIEQSEAGKCLVIGTIMADCLIIKQQKISVCWRGEQIVLSVSSLITNIYYNHDVAVLLLYSKAEYGLRTVFCLVLFANNFLHGKELLAWMNFWDV